MGLAVCVSVFKTNLKMEETQRYMYVSYTFIQDRYAWRIQIPLNWSDLKYQNREGKNPLRVFESSQDW